MRFILFYLESGILEEENVFNVTGENEEIHMIFRKIKVGKIGKIEGIDILRLLHVIHTASSSEEASTFRTEHKLYNLGQANVRY